MPGRREISSRDCEIANAVAHMLDLAARKYGFTRKVLSIETGISESTLRMYEQGTAMPLSTFVRIVGVKDFPNELATLAFEGVGKVLTDSEPDEADLDDLAVAAAELLLRVTKARHRNSPSGVQIDHTERPDIELSAESVADRAGKVARK